LITDVVGVRVGHTTLWEGDDVRTGVTVVVPPRLPCFAGSHTLNGNGEVTGLEWIRESGYLTSPVGLTNTHSVGVVRDALVSWEVRQADDRWHLPVVGRPGTASSTTSTGCMCARTTSSRRSRRRPAGRSSRGASGRAPG
jgi:L-aminopeptidase/D-esterase-like protein